MLSFYIITIIFSYIQFNSATFSNSLKIISNSGHETGKENEYPINSDFAVSQLNKFLKDSKTNFDPYKLKQVSSKCPPKNFQTKEYLDIKTFFHGDWYSLYQLVQKFQPIETFNCVKANYKIVQKKKWWCYFTKCDDVYEEVQIFNQGYNNKTEELNEIELRGIPNSQSSSKATVGPTFLPKIFYGDYFIMAANTYESLQTQSFLTSDTNNYELAIISGGEPKIETENGCTTGVGSNNNKGLWILSRKQIITNDQRMQILNIVKELGYDITLLLPVKQSGCKKIMNKFS